MRKRRVCVVIPAFNEAKVITASIKALKKVVRKENIYVVSDGSVDNTAHFAYLQGVSVMRLEKNVGKARALEKLIRSKNLADKYEYIAFSDADSRLASNFMKEIRKYMDARPACIVGRVYSDRKGFISAFRTYEYGLSHRLIKEAQNAVQVITVAPGCASVYRSDVLEQLLFSRRTLTEDLDLTIQVHEKKLGKILFVPTAKVITQDPLTLRDYWKQVRRWYIGFWQNVFIHRLYLPTKKLNFEVLLLLADASLVFVSLVFLALYPFLVLYTLASIYIGLVVISFIVILLEKKWWAIKYIPFFFFLYMLNTIAFFYSFAMALFTRHEFAWNKVDRY